MNERQPAGAGAGAGVADQVLIARVRDGQKEAFRGLIEKYQDRVFNLLLRILRHPETARDIAQETFLKAFLSLDQYKEEFKFSNWVLKIAQNLAFSHLRHVGVDRERLTLDGDDGPGVEMIADTAPLADPAALIEERELGGIVNRAVEEMAEKYRLVLTLRHTENLAYQDIADVLGIPLGTVKFRLHQAHKLLNEKLVRQKIVG